MPFGFGSRATPRNAAAYKPVYVVPYRNPRNNAEAQNLYNHIRTCALALDSLSRSIPLPFLQQLPPSLDLGLESIIGFIFPVAGDVLGAFMGLYIVFCCFLFGDLTMFILGQMLLNVFFDAAVGIVPFIGDFLDIAFKSNVRNLRLLESHLAKSAKKGGLSVELAPTYEQEFANAPSPSRPSAARTAAAPPGGGVNWAALADLARLFSIGGGGAGSRR